MSVRPLELEYLRVGSRSQRVRLALLAVALAFTADSAWHYSRLKRDASTKEVQIAEARSRQKDFVRPAISQHVSTEEYAFARDTVSKLSTPWDQLFRALEAAQTDQIALLSVEPDPEHRIVTLTGEAKDYLAALTYLASLSEQKSLRRVHLTHHEPQRTASQRPLAFTISAAWTEER
jgi:hypothetical protein